MCRNCVRLPHNNLDIPNHVSFSVSHQTCSYLKGISLSLSWPIWHYYCVYLLLSFSAQLAWVKCFILLIFVILLFSLFSQFVKTILSQGHLTPLPLYVSPVFWAYDYSLRIYPVPDVIVFADKYDPFSITNADCLCVNPVWKKNPENCIYKLNSVLLVVYIILYDLCFLLTNIQHFVTTGLIPKKWLHIQGVLPIQQNCWGQVGCVVLNMCMFFSAKSLKKIT